MAWTYSDWITLTGSSRLARLKLHIQEVADRISERRSFEGMFTDTGDIRQYYEGLLKQWRRLGGGALKVIYPVKELEA